MELFYTMKIVCVFKFVHVKWYVAFSIILFFQINSTILKKINAILSLFELYLIVVTIQLKCFQSYT